MELQDILTLVKAGFTRTELLELASNKSSAPAEPEAQTDELTLQGLDAKIQVMSDAIKALASQQGVDQQRSNMRHDNMGGAGTVDQRAEATSALAQLMGRHNKEE